MAISTIGAGELALMRVIFTMAALTGRFQAAEDLRHLSRSKILLCMAVLTNSVCMFPRKRKVGLVVIKSR